MAFNQPDLFRFSIDIDGELTTLSNAPDGWRAQSFEISRDPEYFGILKKFVTDLEFVLNDAKKLREKAFRSGIDGKAKFFIEKLDQSTWEYYNIYISDIDFSTYEDSITKIKVNLIDGGLTAKLQAYKNVKFDIEFDEFDPYLTLGGVDVLEWANLAAASFTRMTFRYMANYFPSTQLTNYSVVLQGIEFRDQSLEEPDLDYDYTTGDNWMIKSFNFEGEIKISGYFICNGSQEASNGWDFIIRDSSIPEGVIVKGIATTFNTVEETFEEKRIEFDTTFLVYPGIRYSLMVTSNSPQNFAIRFCDIIASEVKLEYTQVSPNVTIRAKKPKKLLKDILNKIDEDDESFVISNILDENEGMLVTSGDAIRNLPEAKIKTSFTDFFDSFHAILSAGISIKHQTMICENVSYFFDDESEIADLGEVKNLKLEPYVKIMHSSIKLGYSKEDYEVAKGREEFNNGQEWSTPIARAQTSLNIVSSYRADQYGIDDLRIKQIKIDANAKDADTSKDNDVFIIHSKKTSVNDYDYEPITSSDLQFIAGVSERSNAYNFLISPKRNLIRHLPLIKSMFYGDNEDGFIKFESADKNANLVTKEFTGPLIIENQNIDINSIPNRLYLPWIAEFDAPYKSNLQYLIDLDRSGYITFSYEGKTYTGFIDSVDISADRGGQTTFKVILTKNNIL